MSLCPINGKPCPYPKTLHITNVDGYTASSEYHICSDCEKWNMAKPEDSILSPLLKGLFQLLNQAFQEKKKIAKTCPHCNITIYDIIKGGRLGCDYCYTFFDAELRPVFAHVHKLPENDMQHVGKVPKPKPVNMDELTPEEQIKLLELQLQVAVEHEMYELAAELKDKIDFVSQTLRKS